MTVPFNLPLLAVAAVATERALREEQEAEDQRCATLRRKQVQFRSLDDEPLLVDEPMTDQNHPVTPPAELVSEWTSLACEEEGWKSWDSIATQAARWGADQELSACCKLLDEEPHDGPMLHAVRRPKPPSLKKQAYNALDTYIYGTPDHKDKQRTYNIIRRALEQLND